MKWSVSIFFPLALLVAANPLARRGLEKCKNLQANSNNGGRKIAIVVDESGSMAITDPYNLRIDAARAVNDWLIPSGKAGNGKDSDLVTVIGFDETTRILYGLGDPSNADKAIDQISIVGGTWIAAGVNDGISELTKSGDDPTANRSGIVVLTDGEDFDTSGLVDSINDAGQKGIRVSFGFLTDDSYSYQDLDVLSAIIGTGGMYATIDGATAQNAFVNLMIVHGLTNNDNPSAKNTSTAYNGLSVAFVLGQDGSSTVTYTAEAGESLTFSLNSVLAGELNVTAEDASGKELAEVTVDPYSSYAPEELHVRASSDGDLKIKVHGEPDQVDALFIVGTNSSIPLVNCTLGNGGGNGGKKGLSTGAKAGIGIAVPLIVAMIAAGSYFAYKYLKGMHSPSASAPPAYAPDQPELDYKQPHVQSVSVPASPYPINTHPGWTIPPPKGPQLAPNNPNNGQLNPSNPNGGQPQHVNHYAPHAPNSGQPYDPNMNLNSGQSQQPHFNNSIPQNPHAGGPHQFNPNSGQPENLNHNASPSGDDGQNQQPNFHQPFQGDTSHQSQLSGHAPANANSGGPDHLNPDQGGPDQPKSDSGGPSHSPQINSNPILSTESNTGGPDNVNTNSGGPDHPSSNSGGLNQSLQTNQGDTRVTQDTQPPNSGSDNPSNPPDHPDPKRLRIPRIPLGRKKKDEENQQGQPPQQQPNAQGPAQPQQVYQSTTIQQTQNQFQHQTYRVQSNISQQQQHHESQMLPNHPQATPWWLRDQATLANNAFLSQVQPQEWSSPPSRPQSPPRQYSQPVPAPTSYVPPTQQQAQELHTQRSTYNVSPLQQEAPAPMNLRIARRASRQQGQVPGDGMRAVNTTETISRKSVGTGLG